MDSHVRDISARTSGSVLGHTKGTWKVLGLTPLGGWTAAACFIRRAPKVLRDLPRNMKARAAGVLEVNSTAVLLLLRGGQDLWLKERWEGPL